MKKLAFGTLAVISLSLCLCIDYFPVNMVLLFSFMYGAQKAGVVNYMEEIYKED